MKQKDSKFMKILPMLALSLVGIALVFILWVIISKSAMIAGIPFSLRFTLNQLVGAPILLALAYLIVNFAIKLDGRLKGMFPQNPRWGELVKNLGILLGIYIAYLALRPLIIPYTAKLGWIFHGIFLAGFALFLGLATFQAVGIVQWDLPALLGMEVAQRATGPRCQYCGKALKPGTKFCPGCGATTATTETAATADSGLPVCVSCKAVLAVGAKFCPQCGSPQK